jgi:hypothetical protein
MRRRGISENQTQRHMFVVGGLQVAAKLVRRFEGLSIETERAAVVRICGLAALAFSISRSIALPTWAERGTEE